jgi:ABC-type uncharacterized transport system substrate-binding protein
MTGRRAFVGALACGCLASTLVRAQPAAARRRVGYLSPGAPGVGTERWFFAGMRELGYVEGVNVVYERRYAQGRFERLPELAADLVRSGVEVIVIGGPIPLPAARAATTTIPIVMVASSSDPVGEGVVASLARPGGNVTGLTYAVSPERFAKQLELLKEAAPSTSRVAVWWDMELAMFHRSWEQPLELAARRLGLQIAPPVQVLEMEGIDRAFREITRQRADAILITMGGMTMSYRSHVADAAIRSRLPTMSAFKEFTQDGGLLSYGPDFPDVFRRGAGYVDRILKGAKAADLPVELPAKYELAVNLKTAKALGLAIPQSLLVRADNVIA